LHFSQTRPPGFGRPTDHPIVAIVADQIERARAEKVVYPEVDATNSALFFLLGVYSLLVTNHQPKPARARILDEFVASSRRGLEVSTTHASRERTQKRPTQRSIREPA
jgi:hypothetical protein